MDGKSRGGELSLERQKEKGEREALPLMHIKVRGMSEHSGYFCLACFRESMHGKCFIALASKGVDDKGDCSATKK